MKSFDYNKTTSLELQVTDIGFNKNTKKYISYLEYEEFGDETLSDSEHQQPIVLKHVVDVEVDVIMAVEDNISSVEIVRVVEPITKQDLLITNVLTANAQALLLEQVEIELGIK